MKTLIVLDAGHRFSVGVREDIAIPELTIEERPAHARFITWWREECNSRGISYAYAIAEPQGHRIVRFLLKTRSFERLQELARHFFLDYGDKLRDNPNHFVIFTSLIEHMEAELYNRGQGVTYD